MPVNGRGGAAPPTFTVGGDVDAGGRDALMRAMASGLDLPESAVEAETAAAVSAKRAAAFRTSGTEGADLSRTRPIMAACAALGLPHAAFVRTRTGYALARRDARGDEILVAADADGAPSLPLAELKERQRRGETLREIVATAEAARWTCVPVLRILDAARDAPRPTKPFSELWAEGSVGIADVPAAVEAWKAAPGGRTLQDALGLDDVGYAAWSRHPGLVGRLLGRQARPADPVHDRAVAAAATAITAVGGDVGASGRIIAAALHAARAGGADPYAMASEAIRAFASREIDGGDGGAPIAVTLSVRTPCPDGDGAVRSVRLDWSPSTKASRNA